MEIILTGLFTILCTSAFAILGFYLLYKCIDMSSLANHQELVQATLSIVGTLYSVLLGFLIAGAVTFHEGAEARVLQEANALCDVFRFARGLPEPERSVIRNTCRKYNHAVLSEEWPQMKKQKEKGSADAWASYYSLWDSVLAVDNKNQQGSNIQQSLMSAMENMGECRRSRMTTMKHHLPEAVWIVVLAGSSFLIGLMYLLVGEKKAIHAILILITMSVLCLNVILLDVYSRPFCGPMMIRPEAFEVNEDMFKQGDLPHTRDEVFGRK